MPPRSAERFVRLGIKESKTLSLKASSTEAPKSCSAGRALPTRTPWTDCGMAVLVPRSSPDESSRGLFLIFTVKTRQGFWWQNSQQCGTPGQATRAFSPQPGPRGDCGRSSSAVDTCPPALVPLAFPVPGPLLCDRLSVSPTRGSGLPCALTPLKGLRGQLIQLFPAV